MVLQVLAPIRVYKGQKLTTEVKANIAATTSPTMTKVPVITFVKYNITNTAATTIRSSLSVLPMFFFISFDLYLLVQISYEYNYNFVTIVT